MLGDAQDRLRRGSMIIVHVEHQLRARLLITKTDFDRECGADNGEERVGVAFHVPKQLTHGGRYIGARTNGRGKIVPRHLLRPRSAFRELLEYDVPTHSECRRTIRSPAAAAR